MNNRAQFIFEYLNYPIYWSNNNTQFYVKRIEIYLCLLMLVGLRRLSEGRRKKSEPNADAHWILSSNAVLESRRPLRKWHLEKCELNKRKERNKLKEIVIFWVCRLRWKEAKPPPPWPKFLTGFGAVKPKNGQINDTSIYERITKSRLLREEVLA